MSEHRSILRFLATAFLFLAALIAHAQEVNRVGNDALAAGKPLQEPHQKAALIRLDGEVDDMMLRSINRRLDLARKAGCTLVVFEIDTYGGLVTSGLEISKLIKKLPAEHINTVAWVHDKAYSAGSMIAVACQQIVMSSVGSLGDCAPIAMTSDNKLVPLPPAERAKADSWLAQEFSESAHHNGYNETLLRAMVVSWVQVHEMHNARTGETAFVDDAGKTKLLAEEADLPGGGKENPWQYVRTVDDDKSLLTVDPNDALKMKLSSATIDSQQQLMAALNIRGELIPMHFNWAERATVFLTSWGVRFLLFVGMLIFAWLEFSHPGISVFGIAALLCLVLLVGAPFLTGLAQIWEIVLIILGLAIIIVDVLVFGGLGMLAIPGFILMAIGLVASFIPADPGGGFMATKDMWNAAEHGMGVLVGGTFLAMVAFYFFAKYLYLTPGFQRLQLAPSGVHRTSASGIDSIRDAADRPAQDAVFVGSIGRAASDLRPAGKARFGDHLVAVVSHGSFIDQGTEVEIIEVSGLRVVVRPHILPQHPAAIPASDSPQPSDPSAGSQGAFP